MKCQVQKKRQILHVHTEICNLKMLTSSEQSGVEKPGAEEKKEGSKYLQFYLHYSSVKPKQIRCMYVLLTYVCISKTWEERSSCREKIPEV